MANATVSQISFATVYSSALSVLSLFVCAAQLPLSVVNIGTLCRTSLLHHNLKFVLSTQSVLFCIYAMAQIAQILVVFTLGQDHWLDFKIILFFIEFPLLYINYIGHVLLIERFIATVFVKKYEHTKNYAFNIIWFTLITSFCVINAAQEVFTVDPNAPITFTVGVLISVFASVFISFCEIIIFSLLIKYNLEMFMRRLQIPANLHNLSERYQLAENIRTGRQLAPTFLLHFISICGSAVSPLVAYFQLITDPISLNLIVLTYFFVLSFSNALIEFTLMRRHPILRKNAVKILSTILSSFSVPTPCCANRISDSAKQMAERMDGQKRGQSQKQGTKSSEMEMYFKMLKEQW